MTRIDRVRNEEMCKRVKIKKKLASRIDLRVIYWFGQVEWMSTLWLEGCSRLQSAKGEYLDGVNVALGSRGMTVKAG